MTVYTNRDADSDNADANSLYQVQMLTVDINKGEDDDSLYQYGCRCWQSIPNGVMVLTIFTNVGAEV